MLDQDTFPSSRSTEKAEGFSPVNFQVNPPQHMLPSEALMQIPDFDKEFLFFRHGENRRENKAI